MAESLSFKDWLVRPGNHRLLKGFRQQLKSLLNKETSIESWRDLYDLFEECLPKSDRAANLFEPIIKQHPPTLENGANQKQVMLYRGVYHEKETAGADTAIEEYEVVYRGQRIVKSTNNNESGKAESPAKTTNRTPRFYRGVRID